MFETKKYVSPGLSRAFIGAVKIILTALLFLHSSNFALSSPNSDWIKTDFAKFRIISGVEDIGKETKIPLGLEFYLFDGWKIYWRNPGDAGFPPSFIETKSNNLEKIEWRWPAPMRFTLDGLQSFGYGSHVVIPLTAQIKSNKEPLNLKTTLSALACREICIPIEEILKLQLPIGTGAPSKFSKVLKNYENLVPTASSWPEFTLVSSYLEGTTIILNINSSQKFIEPDVFFETMSDIHFGKPKVKLSRDHKRATLKVSITPPEGSVSVEFPTTLTFVDKGRSIELNEIIRPSIISKSTNAQFWKSDSISMTIILIAFLGGVILNFMPCVLPVLMIKLLDVSRAVGQDRKLVRLGFLSSAVGIIASFFVLGVIAVLLKKLGVFVTWGMQFQQPVFVTISCILILAFSVSLLGWFKFKAPDKLMDSLSQQTPIRHNQAIWPKMSRHFLTGVFATVLATPCSAPLVGTALTFALGGEAKEIISIFLIMGLGLALPYISISVFPSALAIMPKPGAWMRKLEIFLAILLCMTALWLLTVLSQQISLNLLLLVICFISLAALAILMSRILRSYLLLSISVILAFGAVITSNAASFLPEQKRSLVAEDLSTKKDANLNWKVFHEEQISKYVNAGNTVIVDISADWCITCKVNEELFISNGLIADALKSGELIGMKADWTSPNDKIANYLMSFNRYGIPFTVIYGPKAETGIVLPELLSEDAIKNAIKAASYDK